MDVQLPLSGPPAGLNLSDSSFPTREGESTSNAQNPPRDSVQYPRYSTSSTVRRKPLPANASPVTSPTAGKRRSILNSISSAAARPGSLSGLSSPPVARAAPRAGSVSSVNEPLLIVRDLDKFPHGQTPVIPFPEEPEDDEGPLQSYLYSDDDDDDEEKKSRDKNLNGDASVQPSHTRLTSEPISSLDPNKKAPQRFEDMALQLPPQRKPAPLQLDSNGRPTGIDPKTPRTPGSKITSFFGWNKAPVTSPGADSPSTDISDYGTSPGLSSLPTSTHTSAKSVPHIDTVKANGMMRKPSLGPGIAMDPDGSSKYDDLESEIREISSELAGSIRREMELEDLVERLQMEAGTGSDANRRTSDYFSDSGISSIKYSSSDAGQSRSEEIESIKRASEQERAMLKVELSQKWQEERSRRQQSESHVQILESQVEKFRRERVESSNLDMRARELEVALEDTRRRLAEERQLKDNFEDLLTAMRVELEQHRNERDHLRDNVVPQLRAELKGDLGSRRINSIAEEDGVPLRRGSVGLSRSNSLARVPAKPTGLSRSSSLSRSNSVTAGKDREAKESLVDKMKDIEMQRDALHRTVKSLLERQNFQAREHAKQIQMMALELAKAHESGSPRRLGYEREVKNLRDEINHLRQRAVDALDQKWQCEKGLGGLKMDLDRAEQETSSLRALLQEHDIPIPDQESLAEVQATSHSLEDSYKRFQAKMESADSEYPRALEEEQRLAEQVKLQLETNSALRSRLAQAIGRGERDQKLSATRINEMQEKLKRLEDTLMLAQQHSEEEVAKHEDEVRALKDGQNAQLLRAKNGIRTPVMLSPKPPSSPFGARSPRLDKTTSGEGIALSEAIQAENLEARVKDLERALRDADLEMEEVVGRMNKAQMEVAELQSDRDEALRQTRKLQTQIQTLMS